MVESQIPNLKTFSPNEDPFNISYGDWIAKWWQWNVARENYNTDKCGMNQTGPVWFLPDILAGAEDRTCDIPLGKAIFVPINTGSCWNDGNPQPMNDDELRNCAKEGQDYTYFKAFVNDTEFDKIYTDRTQSPYFNITIPKDSYTRYNADNAGRVVECMECPIGSFRAMADGFFIFLEPLKAGSYVIKYSYDTTTDPNVELQHAAKVAYHINVASP